MQINSALSRLLAQLSQPSPAFNAPANAQPPRYASQQPQRAKQIPSPFNGNPAPEPQKLTVKPQPKKEPEAAPLSGKGSIQGNQFRSGDNEDYTVNVRAGKTYNLLSDSSIGINGTYMSIANNQVGLGFVGMMVGNSHVTISADGTVQVDGRHFNTRNNANGAVTLKNGTYTIKSGEYEINLRPNINDGIKIDIKGANVLSDGVAPGGLWGVSFDGAKDKAAELAPLARAANFEVEDALTFETTNKKGKSTKSTMSLSDAQRGELLFNAQNPKGTYILELLGNQFQAYSAGKGRAIYSMDALRNGSFYNLFSDEGAQLNGRFNNNKLVEVGGDFNGRKLKVEMAGNGVRPKITLDGKELLATAQGGVLVDGVPHSGKPVINVRNDNDMGGPTWEFIFNENGEHYQIKFGQRDGGLTVYGLMIIGNASNNTTRSTGIWGDAFSNGHTVDNGRDRNGAGYLRNEDGLLSRPGDDMSSALGEYQVDELFATEGGRSVYTPPKRTNLNRK